MKADIKVCPDCGDADSVLGMHLSLEKQKESEG